MIMTQEDINNLVKAVVQSENICTAVLMIKENEKDYKQSDFYKQTKIDLLSLIELYKKLNPINMDSIGDLLQREINKLDLTNLTNIFDSFIGESQGAINNFQNEVKEFKETIQ